MLTSEMLQQNAGVFHYFAPRKLASNSDDAPSENLSTRFISDDLNQRLLWCYRKSLEIVEAYGSWTRVTKHGEDRPPTL